MPFVALFWRCLTPHPTTLALKRGGLHLLGKFEPLTGKEIKQVVIDLKTNHRTALSEKFSFLKEAVDNTNLQALLSDIATIRSQIKEVEAQLKSKEVKHE